MGNALGDHIHGLRIIGPDHISYYYQIGNLVIGMIRNQIIRMVSQGYRNTQSLEDITHGWIGLTIRSFYPVSLFLEQTGKGSHPCAANADHVDLVIG